MKRSDLEQLPDFCGTVQKLGFNPDQPGPPRPTWTGWAIDYSLYEFDAQDPKYHRTPSMQEVHAYIPTAAWPAIGDPHGTTAEHDVAPL